MKRIRDRLARLEAKAKAAAPGKWHQVIGDSEAECEAQRRAMIERGEAGEADGFFFHVIVTPSHRWSPDVDVAQAASAMDQRLT
jgi:hypothetical protein